MFLNLRQSSSPWRAELDAIEDAVAMIVFKPDGIVLRANDLFLQTMGFERQEVIGQHHRIFCDQSYVASPAYQRHWQRLNSGEAITDNIRRIRKGGEVVWLQGTYTPVLNKHGEVVEIIKIASEVTSRIIQAQEHQSLLTALNRSMAMITFSPTGIILDANDNMLESDGLSAGRGTRPGAQHTLYAGVRRL